MFPVTLIRALVLALTLCLTAGVGLATARPSDGYRDQQDFATADFARFLDAEDCIYANPSVFLVAGDLLKSTLSGGQPGPWSDVTVVLRVQDVCEETSFELTGFTAITASDFAFDRLTSAWVAPVLVHLEGPGDRDIDATVELTWEATGRAVASTQNYNIGNLYFRAQREAPAAVVGSLDFSDDDNDVWPDDFSLTQDDAYNATIGVANEISVCCP